MDQEINQQRIRKIYDMLFEMAAGNFSFRIGSSGIDDELESLIVLVNMVAEEMKSTILQQGFIHAHSSYDYLVQHTLVLNKDFVIKRFTADAAINLGHSEENLLGTAFGSLLDADSLLAWNLIKDVVLWDRHFHKTFPITFISETQLLIPTFCTISRLLHSSKILVSSVSIVMTDNFSTNAIMLNSDLKESQTPNDHDAELIQQLYDYILENLERQLPTIKELSLIFKTNEFKLKSGFRHFFKTSIYQFYNDERLKRAHLLIQQTSMPLKNIALMSGFSTYANFAKAFKKRFTYSPNVVKRR